MALIMNDRQQTHQMQNSVKRHSFVTPILPITCTKPVLVYIRFQGECIYCMVGIIISADTTFWEIRCLSIFLPINRFWGANECVCVWNKEQSVVSFGKVAVLRSRVIFEPLVLIF